MHIKDLDQPVHPTNNHYVNVQSDWSWDAQADLSLHCMHVLNYSLIYSLIYFEVSWIIVYIFVKLADNLFCLSWLVSAQFLEGIKSGFPSDCLNNT